MRRTARVALLLGCAMAFTVPASAATVRTEQNFIHCNSGALTPLGNVNILTDGVRPGWDTTPPAGSLSEGSGCGFYSTGGGVSGANYGTIYDVMAAGSFVGNLGSLTVRAYAQPVGAGRTGSDITLTIHLGIDSKSMFGVGSATGGTPAPATKTVKVKPVVTPEGFYMLEYSVTGLGFVTETGDAEEHVVELTINASSERGGAAWVLDTVETPASVTFNPATPAAAKIAATTPGPV